MKPGFGKTPVTFDGCGSDTQNVCCFFNGETAEVAQLNHARFLWIERCQGLERVVQRNQLRASFDRSIDVFIQGEFLKILATFFRIVLARMIHQQATHYLCSNPEKMSAVLPVHPRLIDESSDKPHEPERSVAACDPGVPVADNSPQAFAVHRR